VFEDVFEDVFELVLLEVFDEVFEEVLLDEFELVFEDLFDDVFEDVFEEVFELVLLEEFDATWKLPSCLTTGAFSASRPVLTAACAPAAARIAADASVVIVNLFMCVVSIRYDRTILRSQR
jgi:hypothetical protein